MKIVEAYVEAKDMPFFLVNSPREWQNVWDYDSSEHCKALEIGKIVLNNLTIKILASASFQPERLNPEDFKHKKALEICDSLNSTNK